MKGNHKWDDESSYSEERPPPFSPAFIQSVQKGNGQDKMILPNRSAPPMNIDPDKIEHVVMIDEIDHGSNEPLHRMPILSECWREACRTTQMHLKPSLPNAVHPQHHL